MRARPFVVASTLFLLTGGATAGTKVQMNIVPTPPDCFVGPGFCLNVAAGCTIDNSECALGTMSSKSKVKLDGKRAVSASIKGVTDVAGALLTTGPAETALDNLVLKIVLSACPVDTGSPPICDDATNVFLKVVLEEGKGSVKTTLPDLGLLVGSPVGVLGVSLVVPGANPGDCPGTNSTADIAARLNDATCDTGVVRGVAGIVLE